MTRFSFRSAGFSPRQCSPHAPREDAITRSVMTTLISAARLAIGPMQRRNQILPGWHVPIGEIGVVGR